MAAGSKTTESDSGLTASRLPAVALIFVAALGLAAAAWMGLDAGLEQSHWLAGLSVLSLAAAGLLENQRFRTSSVASGVQAWSDAEQRAADLDAVRREHAKLRMSLDGVMRGLVDNARSLEEREQALRSELANLESLLLEVRQARIEANEGERHWDEFAVSLVQLLHRSRDLEAVRGVHEHVLERLTGVGLDVLDPARGASFEEHLHRVVDVDESSELPTGSVIRTVTPGLRRGAVVVRHAEVVVAAQSAASTDRPAADAGLDTGAQS
ncbi:MAG: nucleotide exchange factor GrpE [Proteobacteria bacterium]|nr:nucleotide exchange factor GrpE [Pseudomonadota bacterium]